MFEDKLLIWRIKHGSSEALGRVYKKYKDNLLRLAFALFNDRDAAEDIVHDCFVSIAQSAERLKLSGNFKSYLATCVVNRVRNARKIRQRQSALGRLTAENVSLDETLTITSDFKRPEQWIIENERLKLLNNAMAQLPYEQREVVILHIQGEMKFRAIAELQGVSINTVQSRYRYGLDKLRSILNSEVKI
ncbi:MAG: sigma-70 family RNA polymerase sigma factor [Sedimentisphaerales bacterium]|nr:sigma-70 family RNA polymerase sigma factor [Sedimentisphaerales bacterium]